MPQNNSMPPPFGCAVPIVALGLGLLILAISALIQALLYLVPIAMTVLLFIVTETLQAIRGPQQPALSALPRTTIEKENEMLALPPGPSDGFQPVHFPLIPGQETQSPGPLPAGQFFLITFEGTYSYCRWWQLDRYADCCYDAGEHHNFYHKQRYWGLGFDRCCVYAVPVKEDPENHTYSFSYTGRGVPLSLLLLPPGTPKNPDFISGPLTVTITLDTTQRDAAETRRREAEESRRAEEEQIREAEAQCEQRLYELAIHLELFPHYADPDFLKKHATMYQKSLLERREEILNGNAAFHEDRGFINYLREHAPHLYDRVIWQVKALALAEQLAAEPPPTPPLPPSPAPSLPTPRPRLTPEEKETKFARYRSRIVEDIRVKGHDYMAKRKAQLDLIDQYASELDRYQVDAEEKDQLIREFKAELLQLAEKEDADGHFKRY